MLRLTNCVPGCVMMLAIAVAVAEGRERPPVVLRISQDALGSVQRKTFTNEQDVNDLVLGTKIRGKATTGGDCAVETCKGESSSGLQVCVKGVSVTKSEGRNGPAIIHSTTTTTFTATAPLRFDIERGLIAEDLEVDAQTTTTTDKIDSTQSGIAGTFVKKLAAKKVEESREEAQEIARDLAIVRIRRNVSEELNARLERLNQSHQHLLPALKALSKDADSWRLVVKSGQLHVCLAGGTMKSEQELPALIAAADLIVPMSHVDALASTALAKVTQPFAVGTAKTRAVKTSVVRLPRIERREGWLIVSSQDVRVASTP